MVEDEQVMVAMGPDQCAHCRRGYPDVEWWVLVDQLNPQTGAMRRCWICYECDQELERAGRMVPAREKCQ